VIFTFVNSPARDLGLVPEVLPQPPGREVIILRIYFAGKMADFCEFLQTFSPPKVAVSLYMAGNYSNPFYPFPTN